MKGTAKQQKEVDSASPELICKNCKQKIFIVSTKEHGFQLDQYFSNGREAFNLTGCK